MMLNVGVIGAGTMGAGIAQVAAVHGCRVYLREPDPSVALRAVEGIRKQLDRLVEKGRMSVADQDSTLLRLSVAQGVSDLASCELVIEAIVEDLDTKVRVLSEIKRHVSPEAVFASNTSSLSIAAIGEGMGAADRTVGMHFFNPAPLMPLVEVISSPATLPAYADFVDATARRWGKTVVRAKDTPGFIVNRVARGYYLEALRMVGEGVATVSEVDEVMRSCGFRMGPFELMDLVGIDVNYAVSRSVWEQFGRPVRLTPHPIQADLVKAGHLGRKTAQGIYDYSKSPPTVALQLPGTVQEASPGTAQAVLEFAAGMGRPDLTADRAYVAARVLSTVMNEAGLALQEEVASAEHIDIAMKTGTNYPKGPLEWAKEVGYPRVRAVLHSLNHDFGDGRFTPARLFEVE